MNNVDLSIIIVSYNTKNLMDKCLETTYKSLKRTKVRTEIIVVDNGSKDGSLEMITLKYPQVILVENKLNLGFGQANNQGVKKSQGKYILFLNSDIEVIDKAIDNLYQFLIIQRDKTIVGGKLYNPDLTPQSSCGPEYSLKNIIIALFFKGDHLKITRYSPDKIKQVDWVMGACFAMKKDFFQQIGKFDEGIFMYMEEIDLEYRAKIMGGQIIFYPQARFVHVGAGSSKGRGTPILNVFKGLKYFYKKHKNKAENIILRAILVLKSIFAIILFVLINKKSDRDLYIKALNISIS